MLLRGTCFDVSVQDAQDEAEDEHRFTPFTGIRRRLDGKPLKDDAPTITSSVKDRKSEAANSRKQSTPSTSQSGSSRQNMGKLVFGSHSSHASREAQKVDDLFLPSHCLCYLIDNKGT